MTGRRYQGCLRVIKNYIQKGRSFLCLNLQLIFNLDTIIKEGIPFAQARHMCHKIETLASGGEKQNGKKGGGGEK